MFIKKLCLKILGIKEEPFLRVWIGTDNMGNPIFIYTGHKGEKIIKDKLDLWPRCINNNDNKGIKGIK